MNPVVKSKLILLFVFFGLTKTFNSFAQSAVASFADTIFIYKGFGVGGTTASLWYYSHAVDTMHNVSKVQLSKKYVDTLNYLLAHVTSKKHFQQKVGPSFYASVVKNGDERRIALLPKWAVIDLSKKRQYVFKDSSYEAMYQRLIDANFQ